MRKKEIHKIRILTALAFLLGLAGVVRADIPPPEDFERVREDLIIRTADDLSDYRFFLDFYGDLREIEVKSKGETVIPPSGGGARYSNAAVYAVPRASLIDFGDDRTPETMAKIQQAVAGNKIRGVVRLFAHQFVRERPKGSKPSGNRYSIRRSGNTLTAEMNAPSPPASDAAPPAVDSGLQTRLSEWKGSLIVAGTLIAAAVLVIGLWLVRRLKTRA